MRRNRVFKKIISAALAAILAFQPAASVPWAPAVEVSSVRGKITGTSMAAAIAAGAAAAFLQWSTVEQNDILVDNADIRSYLIRGATRNAGLIYPNREYGYGLLNLRGVFDSLIGR